MPADEVSGKLWKVVDVL